VAAVVLEGENTKVVGKNPVIDGVRKARHQVMPDICLAGAPTLGSLRITWMARSAASRN